MSKVVSSEDYSAPGDRRRFAGFAQRNGIVFGSISQKAPQTDAVVLTMDSDISK